jgi:hypothetical protein
LVSAPPLGVSTNWCQHELVSGRASTNWCQHELVSARAGVSTSWCQHELVSAARIGVSTNWCQHELVPARVGVSTNWCQHHSVSARIGASTSWRQHELVPASHTPPVGRGSSPLLLAASPWARGLAAKRLETQRRHGRLKDWAQALPQQLPQWHQQRHRPTAHSFLY